MLTDVYQRRFVYLRLSLLPICNFRCIYCLPNGNPKETLHKNHLSLSEIRRLISAFSGLGIKKIRLTGGEPTLRSDLIDITQEISSHPKIDTLALTTNGYRLSEIIKDLKESGLNSLNVSVDSLDPNHFHSITGQNLLSKVLGGIKKSQEVGIQKIKINTVILKGINDNEISSLITWAEYSQLELRFIELMSTEDTKAFFQKRHRDLGFIELFLAERGYHPIPRENQAGPADMWQHPSHLTKIGLIRPYRTGFCDSCNRLRVTSEGALQLCLFGSGVLSLRSYLQEDGQEKQIQEAVLSALTTKTKSHFLHEANHGITRNLASIGG